MTDPNVISYLLNAGMAGVLAFLVIRGLIYGKPSMDRVLKDGEQWRKLYEAERQAHELTRKAHAEEVRAALQAAAEGSQVAAALLVEIKSRQSEAPR
ncbi:hypothetical protein [Nonomuraea bangladeshensis]|uniref:hypothetical protein n=1 Tax=Nonomuraea bangladeshensis TaxID=404385 RepID=UPI003C2BE131